MSTERELAPATAVRAAIAALPPGRWLLAVSGGRDSMALLHAVATERPGEVAAVANFDHGTGAFATGAAALVQREALRRSLPSVSGVAEAGSPSNEAAWRAARHAFLDAWAAELGAAVLTAHTRDDQIETVVQRLLREAGPRGLAGIPRAPGASRRSPLLHLPRATVAAYVADEGIAFMEDPSNATLDFQRNRVRHELLPALERAAPGFGEWCWSLGERSAEWRSGVEALVATLLLPQGAGGSAVVAALPLATCGAREWAVLWPAIAAHAGVVMDRRGIERASAWAPRAKAGQTMPLSGDASIERTGTTFVLKGTPGGPQGYILQR